MPWEKLRSGRPVEGYDPERPGAGDIVVMEFAKRVHWKAGWAPAERKGGAGGAAQSDRTGFARNMQEPEAAAGATPDATRAGRTEAAEASFSDRPLPTVDRHPAQSSGSSAATWIRALSHHLFGPTADETQQRYAKRVRMLLEKALVAAILGHVVSGTIILVVLLDVFPDPLLLPWFSGLMAVVALRVAYIEYWRYHAWPDWMAPRVAAGFALLAGAAGAAWGFAGVHFILVDQPLTAALMIVFLGGMTAGGLGPLGASLPSFTLYISAALLPTSGWLFLSGEPIYSLFGVAVVAYWANNLFVAYRLNRRLIASIRLESRNDELLQELDARCRAADAANQAKSRFLAAASHDIRHPLHALHLFVELAQRSKRARPSDELLAKMQEALRSAREMLDGLLNISRLDAGVVRAKPELVELRPIFRRMKAGCGAVAESRGVDLRIRDTHAVVYTDRVLLESILQNLVSNAVRYSAHGRVFVAARRRGSRWRIEVRDNGPGIPEHLQARIFGEFERGVIAGSNVEAGLGLGLAIVQRMARLLGHQLDLRSRPGTGSVFAVEADVAQGAPSAVPRAQTRPEIEGLEIALVDSDPATREATAELLVDCGCHVRTFRSPDGVGASFRRLELADVVIVDCPVGKDGQGVAAASRLKAQLGARVPVVVVTGAVAPAAVVEAQAAGDRVLHKPVTVERLLRAIAELRSARDSRPKTEREGA